LTLAMTQPPPTQAAYEHNGQPVSRSGFYAIACDPARNVAVEACAGAGKTWMLVSRMLRALLAGAQPHEILAITFTKKAAGEMRERLHQWLQQFAHQTPAQLVQELVHRGMTPDAAAAHAPALQGLYQQVLASGRPVQIRTFHSWFAALLGTAPVAVLQAQGLPMPYELLEDDTQAVQAVWRPFLRAVAANADLRADYQASVHAYGRSQTHKALEAGLAKRVEFALADAAGVVDASIPHFASLWPDLQGLPTPAHALLCEPLQSRCLEWAKDLGAQSKATPQKAAAAIIDAMVCHNADERLQQLRDAFFVAKEDRLTAHLEKFPAAQEAEPQLQRLCAAQRQHQAYLHQQRMARLLRCMVGVFADLKRQRGWVDMNDIERTAQLLLDDPVLSGWVQERLDARVRHLLIDEFQDTNPLQWQALHAWLSGYAGAGGGSAPSVFIVGDPKQSIYRFRRAEPQVFVAAQEFLRDAMQGDLLSCDHTHRNAQGVIAAVNHTLLEAQAQRETQGFRSHTTESTAAGALLCLPLLEAVSDAGPSASVAWRDSLTQPRHEAEQTLHMREAAQAAQWVAACIAQGTPAQRIMVLARKRQRLALMQDALRALHIPCVQPEKSDLADAPEVQDIVALLDALVSPTHNLSLARALKSPLFGVADEALAQLAVLRRQPAHAFESWFDLLSKTELKSADGIAVTPVLDQYQAWLQQWPPHDALHAIYTHGDVLARFAAAAPATRRAAVVGNLRALLAAALAQGGGRYLTPYAWVRALRQGGMRAPGRVDDAAVRLLTVHGAKGLEADCVLLLDTHPRPQSAETMGVLVDWPGAQPQPRLFAFVASETRPPPSIASALAAEQQARQREEINTLYVAMTRARHTLVLSASQPDKGADPRSWWCRLQAQAQPLAADAFAAPAAPSTQPAQAAEPDAVTLAELPAWQPEPAHPVREEIAVDHAAQSTPESRMGEAMHQLLEQAGLYAATFAAQGWPPERIAQLARDFNIAPHAAAHAARMAQNILAGEGAWAWDATHIDTAINEAPLSHQGQSLRIDRLVHCHGASPYAGWWVLDYKSASQPQQQPALQAQLQRYRSAVQAAQPGQTVHAAFLTGDGRLLRLPAQAAAASSAPSQPAKPALAGSEGPQGTLF
jgi:ATP-dependent helicase/nuclease subunit A